MNAYLNFLLEASIGLCLFLLVYQLFLRKETSFRLNRIFLLVAIIASVTFPLLKLNTVDSPVPSLNFSVETAATEELTYTVDDSALVESYSTLTTWEILALLYAAGLLVFLVVFVIRLTGMLKALKQAAAYTYNNNRIVELKSQNSPFSFFNYIFIGSTPPLTEKEKQQIIEHESIHAKLYHSFDILLLNALGIIFWFNPVIRIYKKIFVQLHEFEADARAAEKHDVDEYCSLLAKVALHSADFKLANHFSNSLTLKRIEMMRTLKQKIKSWKVIAVAMVIPIVFFVVSCQDQVESPKYIVKKDGNQPLALPEKVQQELDKLGAQYPNDEFVVVSPGGHNPKDFEGKHAKHISTIDGTTVFEANKITVVEDGKDNEGNPLRYMILQYTGKQKFIIEDQGKETVGEIHEEPLNQINGEPIFWAVEQAPEFPGGADAFRSRINKKLQYPAGSKRLGIEGKVFIKFVVKKDGTLTNFEIIKGINQELDLEALRLLKTEAQGWKPGSQNGKIVHAQFAMPIEFKLQ